MGAWGYGPFDNDTAGDMCAALTKHVTRVAEGRKNGDYETCRVAAQFLLVSHGTDILGGPGLGEVVRALVRMRCDTDYLLSAREPKKLAAALDMEMTAALARMQACRGCRREYNKRTRKEFVEWVNEALGAAVPKPARSKKRNRNNLGLRPGQARPKRRIRSKKKAKR